MILYKKCFFILFKILLYMYSPIAVLCFVCFGFEGRQNFLLYIVEYIHTYLTTICIYLYINVIPFFVVVLYISK